MMKKLKLQFILLLISSLSFGQGSDNFYSRLQAISNNGVDFFNIDGVEITSQKVNALFTTKNIVKKFKQLKIKENELVSSDSLLGFKNYYVFKSEEEPKGLHNNISYYFIETSDQKILGFTFASVNKTDKEFEQNFIRLVIDNLIPKSVYNNLQIDSINFAGRKIPLGGSCHWMGVNNVQCHFYGQMNWSVHKDIDDAQKTVNNQFETIKAGNNGKIIADTIVNVTFEGTKTTAKRVIYDFTGITSALVGMSGGKTLTIYFVAAPVRQNYVSCVMSFWNNDQINPSGLAPLLEQVMKLN
jgi:hypothetical protein